MIQPGSASLIVRKADLRDALGISRVCSDGFRDTYPSIYTPEHIEQVVSKYYSLERISDEIDAPLEYNGATYDWDGWLVAERGDGRVLGASGGRPGSTLGRSSCCTSIRTSDAEVLVAPCLKP